LVLGLLLAAVAGLAAWLLPKLIDPNRYRHHIAALVRAETGRELQLGPMQLKVFPWLRLTVADASLGNAADFGAEPMLTLAQLDLGLRLWPLLRARKVVVDVVRLRRPVLRLAHDATGRSNWQDLLDWQRRRPESAPLDLDLAGIELADARIIYRSAAGQALHLGPLHASSGGVQGARPVALRASTLFAHHPSAAAGRLELALAVDWQEQRQALGLSKLTVDGRGVLATGAAPITANVQLKTEAVTLQLAEHWALQTAPIAIEVRSLRFGDQAAPKLFAFGEFGLTLAGQGRAQSLALKALRADAQLRGSWLPKGEQWQPVSAAMAAAQWQLNTQSGAVQGLQLSAYGLPASADLQLQLPPAGPQSIRGRVMTPELDVRAVLGRMGLKLPPMTSAQALRSVRLAAELHYQRQAAESSLAFSDIDAVVDASRLNGEFRFAAFRPLAMALDLRVDRLRADGYLPPAPPPASAATPIQQMDFAGVEAVLAQLQTLPITGRLRFAALSVAGVEAEDLEVKLTANGAPLRKR
jgi:AsmA protein